MWDGDEEVTVRVPVSGGENVMVPVVRAIVRSLDDADLIILQRRDDPSESVRGRIEIPGGRWQAGESPEAAVTREVVEETGIEVVRIMGVTIDRLDDRRAIASVSPLTIAAGVDGAFPAVHVVLVVDARGEPRPEPGESADVRWWHIDAVRVAMETDRMGFIPSTYAALEAYLAWLAEGDDR
jgi:8-oxo-dGTP pyrophosphatase MutT (NUDIX family)